ncbi:MAG TPA: hypothetical protein VFE03_01335 [Caulobacteraceae bacterium]|nr:hypothetical protein [Caulobacteraceae bacterium]
MTKRRKTSRPADPMEIARRRAEERARAREPQTWGADPAALRLPANVQVDLQTDARGRVSRARRVDVFELFRSRGSLRPASYDAVRRLQDEIATLHRTPFAAVSYTPRVDSSRRPGVISDASHRAGRRIDQVLSLTGLANARLLAALCEIDMVLGRTPDWRATVVRETGERLADAQGARVRAACDNLAEAYAELDRNRRRAGS